MVKAVLRRLAVGALTLWVVTVLVFLIIHNLDGDPVSVLLRQYATPETRAALEAHWGLDRTLPEQYLTWLGNVATGDFGTSITSNIPVRETLAERLPRTLGLMAGGLLLALLVAIPCGMWAAAHKGKPSDHALTVGSLTMQAQPEFWIGTLLVLIFGVHLKWLPTSGYVSPSESVIEWIRHSILPMVTIATITTGIILRTVRSSMVTELEQDHVLLARSKGVPGWRIVSVHAWRNAASPTATLVGLQVGILMSGAVITERVFAYPGMGLALVRALVSRDYPVVQSGILVFAAMFIIVNIFVDMLALWLDPKHRTRVAGGLK